MVRCDRCNGYVSRDYSRVFGDNQDRVTSCPNCRAGWDDGEESTEEPAERKVSFRMSEFESTEDEGDGESAEDGREGRFGRVGKAVSGLF